jgi:hypothetical protein
MGKSGQPLHLLVDGLLLWNIFGHENTFILFVCRRVCFFFANDFFTAGAGGILARTPTTGMKSIANGAADAVKYSVTGGFLKSSLTAQTDRETRLLIISQQKQR